MIKRSTIVLLLSTMPLAALSFENDSIGVSHAIPRNPLGSKRDRAAAAAGAKKDF